MRHLSLKKREKIKKKREKIENGGHIQSAPVKIDLESDLKTHTEIPREAKRKRRFSEYKEVIW